MLQYIKEKGMCKCADLEPHHPPLQQQPWGLCCLQLRRERTHSELLMDSTQNYGYKQLTKGCCGYLVWAGSLLIS